MAAEKRSTEFGSKIPKVLIFPFVMVKYRVKR